MVVLNISILRNGREKGGNYYTFLLKSMSNTCHLARFFPVMGIFQGYAVASIHIIIFLFIEEFSST